VLYD